MSVALWSAVTGPEEVPPPGSGDVVLVHGSLDRSAGMLKLSRRLDADWRVTRYDRRGYGRSTECGGPFTLDVQIADLVDIIERHADQPVVAFGHSFGGNVVLGVADRRPDLVRAVVVYESPAAWLDWWPAESAGRAAGLGGDDPAAAAESFMRHLVGNRRWERLPESTRAARRAEGPALVGEMADLPRRAPWAPQRVTAPVLAMYGELGRPHHRAAMEWVAEVVPHARLHEVAGAHHFGPNTHAPLVAGAIRAFVAASQGA